METVGVKNVKQELEDRLIGFDLSLCCSCGTCSGGCPVPGTPGMEGWDPRKALRMIRLGLLDEVVASDFPRACTGCGRCAHACPMGLDPGAVFAVLKRMRSPKDAPGALHKGVLAAYEGDVGHAQRTRDYLMLLADLGLEAAAEGLPGFYVPVAKRDAKVAFAPSSKELFGDFETLKWWWKIFYAAREDWTMPGAPWDAFGWDAPVCGGERDPLRSCGAGRLLTPDCGGAYGCRTGMEACRLNDPQNAVRHLDLYRYVRDLVVSGRIRLDPSKHRGRVFTWHDSCKHVRALELGNGGGWCDLARFLLEACVGRENWVELIPNRANTYCCGAGGGDSRSSVEAWSIAHGRFKARQIEDSGADVVVVGCFNCREQLMKRLPEHHPQNRRYEVRHLWELVAESLMIEPWSPAEAARAQAQADAHWDRLGLLLEIGSPGAASPS